MTIETAIQIGTGSITTGELPVPAEGMFLEDFATAAERNTQRGLFAGLALHAYAQRTAPGGDEPTETLIGDVLADLRHLCDSLGLDFAGIDDQAHRRYLEEIGGEG